MSDSGQIAVDIVLLPPVPIMDAIIAVNRRLVTRTGNREVMLDKQDTIPHITLAMGTMEVSELAALGRRLDEIARMHLPLATTITGLAVVPTSTGTTVSGFNVRKTNELQALHESVMQLLLTFDAEKAAAPMIAGWEHEQIDPFTTGYISAFSEEAAYGNYSPHITLGYGDARKDLAEFSVPLPVLCTSAAICHLGNFCTCKEILSTHPEG
ncbi:MAG: 2'-5' RNA ligase family protein [Methanomicrobiaceae archaeon]|nr:2'-5' RNA ligase family protein [Methanomicrobiaceae archaeon]